MKEMENLIFMVIHEAFGDISEKLVHSAKIMNFHKLETNQENCVLQTASDVRFEIYGPNRLLVPWPKLHRLPRLFGCLGLLWNI